MENYELQLQKHWKIKKKQGTTMTTREKTMKTMIIILKKNLEHDEN